jgi:SpoIID/LytB domain protein
MKCITGHTAPLFIEEPEIDVGIIEGARELRGCFEGAFRLDDGRTITGPFEATPHGEGIALAVGGSVRIAGPAPLHFRAQPGATLTLSDVTIGVRFHWERLQQQTFQGDLVLLADNDGRLTAVNRLGLEDYLASVVSSEMSATAPPEMLKAHAVASRSWLAAMLERRGKTASEVPPGQDAGSGARARAEDGTGRAGHPAEAEQISEIVRWYGREDHRNFDVCADDHCQRYHGVGKIIAGQAGDAVQTTRGVFLVFDGRICDARYHKACGGRTDGFENTWEDRPVPYLSSVADAETLFDPVITEAAAQNWVHTRPDAFCNTTDDRLLRRVLPDFDQETADFFRWRVRYGREELETILARKSGIDFGRLIDLVPLQRGPSGRIMRLRIEGSRRTVTVGRELEIRRWLSRSHLYSSAFCVSVERDAAGAPAYFVFDGAGWGHGVGMCQIGAAVMAEKGYEAEAILKHYFRGAELKKLYD